MSKHALAKAGISTFDAAFELKADVADDGSFEGYAAVFNNVDRQGDIIEPGAFKKTLTEQPVVPILWQHDPDRPIGVSTDMAEDTKGLHVRGQLAMGVQLGREARELMALKAIGGLSIGYRAIKPTFEKGVRRLREVALVEFSPVTFPANPLATVDSVKYGMLDWTGDDDACQVSALLDLIAAGTMYAVREGDGDDPQDAANLAAIQAILGQAGVLLARELAEVGSDPQGDSTMVEMMSARAAAILTKEGRVLSAANRQLVEQAVEALKALLTASEPAAKGHSDTDGSRHTLDEPGVLLTLRALQSEFTTTPRR